MLQAGHTIARAVRILRCSFLAPAGLQCQVATTQVCRSGSASLVRWIGGDDTSTFSTESPFCVSVCWVVLLFGANTVAAFLPASVAPAGLLATTSASWSQNRCMTLATWFPRCTLQLVFIGKETSGIGGMLPVSNVFTVGAGCVCFQRLCPTGVHRQGDQRIPLHASRPHASERQATSLLSALNVSVSKVSALLAFVGKETSGIHNAPTGGGAIAVGAECVGWQCRFSDGAHVNKFAHEFTGTGKKKQQSLNAVVMTMSSFSNFIGSAWDGAVDIETVARPHPFFV